MQDRTVRSDLFENARRGSFLRVIVIELGSTIQLVSRQCLWISRKDVASQLLCDV